MIYVYRNGQLVPKQTRAMREIDFPMISRFEAYASPHRRRLDLQLADERA